LSPERQLALLDGFAGSREALAEFGTAYARLQSLRAEHAALGTAEAAREQEIELLRHQVEEIAAANLSLTEEEENSTRYRLASNSKRLLELASALSRRLSEADDAILSQLAETQRLLRDLEKIDPEQATLAEAHAACVVELSEIARVLARYAEQLDLDPAQLAALEERVTLFETLKRKYGGSVAEVIAFGERAAERLRKIEGRDAELQRLGTEIESSRRDVDRIGKLLRKLRAKAAPKLAESIRANLRDLGFRQSEFEAKLIPLDEPRASGFDALELLFSPNPGEPLKPLRTIASSGESSRLMLAVKSSLAAEDAIPLLVFDEIDANVGGEIANGVGQKMRALARDHQVLCITHLPQVAAAAAIQFVVTKEVAGGRTHSRLTEVTGKARQEEIARMLGGKTASALQHAASLLKG
jgi:DNA repair protein RecN (Recombination protein N)